jgi:hypothetical protein
MNMQDIPKVNELYKELMALRNLRRQLQGSASYKLSNEVTIQSTSLLLAIEAEIKMTKEALSACGVMVGSE